MQKRVSLTARLPRGLHRDLEQLVQRMAQGVERRLSRNDVLVEALRLGVDTLWEATSTKARRQHLRQEDARLSRLRRENKELQTQLQAMHKQYNVSEKERQHYKARHASLEKHRALLEGSTVLLLLRHPQGGVFADRVSLLEIEHQQGGLFVLRRHALCRVLDHEGQLPPTTRF